jgi:ribosome-binding protein aMBF1 (putative translation factor)
MTVERRRQKPRPAKADKGKAVPKVYTGDELAAVAEQDALDLKRAWAGMFAGAMQEQGLSKAALARRLETSRSAVNRLLDPDDTAVTLITLTRAARALGLDLMGGLIRLSLSELSLLSFHGR